MIGLANSVDTWLEGRAVHLCKTASIEGVMQVRGLRASEVRRLAG